MNQTKSKFSFFTVLKYFFYFIFIVIHVQFIRGTLEVIPAHVSFLSEQTEGTITGKHTKISRSSNSTSRYSNHYTTSYYVDFVFEVTGSNYENTDLVDEQLYDRLNRDAHVTVNYFKGFPQVAILEVNKDHGTKNHLLLTSILIGVDILIFLIWRWIKRKRAKRK